MKLTKSTIKEEDMYFWLGEEAEQVTKEEFDNRIRKSSEYFKLFEELYEHIRHGDEEHQRWLKEEMDQFFSSRLKKTFKRSVKGKEGAIDVVS